MHLYSPRSCTEKEEWVRLQEYASNFGRLKSLDIRWLGEKGPSPLPQGAVVHQKMDGKRTASDAPGERHGQTGLASQSALHPRHNYARPATPIFQDLTHLHIENAKLSAKQIRSFISQHRHILEDVTFESISIVSGTWDQALDPLLDVGTYKKDSMIAEEMGDVPIMLAPSISGAGRTRVTVNSIAQLQPFDKYAIMTTEPKANPRHAPLPPPPANRNLQDSGAAQGVKCLLSRYDQPNRPKRKIGGVGVCKKVIRAVKCGLLNCRK